MLSTLRRLLQSEQNGRRDQEHCRHSKLEGGAAADLLAADADLVQSSGDVRDASALARGRVVCACVRAILAGDLDRGTKGAKASVVLHGDGVDDLAAAVVRTKLIDAALILGEIFLEHDALVKVAESAVVDAVCGHVDGAGSGAAASGAIVGRVHRAAVVAAVPVGRRR